MSQLILYAIPGFVVLLVLEMLLLRGRKLYRGYEWRDTLASLAMGIGSLLFQLPFAALVFGLSTFVYQYRLFELSDSWWIWPLLLLSEDLCYYWFHRAHHRVRILWAGHVNHHSSQHYNLSTALRQPWTTAITGPVFWLPLPLIGFEPTMILTAQAISLIYQYWIHTELVGSLGAAEWVLNTPSHHRVHHGSNSLYLDRNHGGVLIVWDRLFKTFQEEGEPVRYGLTEDITSFNPLHIAFHEWVACLRDLRSARRISSVLRHLFAPPGS